MQSCAVIGCGPAGMVASTALRQSGLLVTCFDMAPGPGGIWSSNTRDIFSSRGAISPIYPSMRCVLPKELMSFSDVRFAYNVPQFPHHTAVAQYLQQYATQKGVRGLTRYNTKVESLRLDPLDGRWKVISVNVTNGDVMEWVFDKICVCTGQTQEVRLPADLRTCLDEYRQNGGEVHHAAHVKDFRAFRGRRVVVVGDGVSAYEYCAELQKMGAEVVHSTTLQPQRLQDSPCTSSSFSGAMWKDKAATEMSDLRVAADTATQLLGLMRRLPWLRHDVHAAKDIVRKWLRYRTTQLGNVQTVGAPVQCDSRGIRFAADPTVRRSVEAVVAEAQERAWRRNGGGDLPPPSEENSTGQGVFLDHVDAVICATGYTRRYPFLHADVRRTLEEDAPLRLTPSTDCGASKEGDKTAAVDTQANRRGLYLGTLWCEEPSLAVIGHQKELLPPFLLFEAQSRFVAYAFTQRVPLPEGAAALAERETQLTKENPLLKDLYSPDGVGLHSAVYFNVLQQELGVSSRETYTARVLQRRRWLLYSMLVRIYNKFRAMAPLKRKKQHMLFSNKV